MSQQVLIIDDDLFFTRLLAVHLKAQGLTVQSAETAAAGLQFLKTSEPDLIFLDIHLPDKLGVDLVADIKKSKPKTPILMVSSSEDTRHIVQSIQNGASDYFKKPIEPEAIWEKVVPLLEMRRTWATRATLSRFELLLLGGRLIKKA